jgi:hypothetical protein
MIPPRPREAGRGGIPGGWWGQRATPLTRRLRALVLSRVHPVAPYVRAVRCGRDLVRTAGDETRFAAPDAVIACVTYRNERVLLGSFLAHHRALGIGGFVFLDLSTQGELAARLAGDADCVVWRPRPGRWESAESWSNVLRFRHGVERWCLSVSACDFLVFPRCESRSIRSLTDFLETEHRDHAFAVTVHMYGEGPAEAVADGAAADPFSALPLFDPVGYVTSASGEDGTVRVGGGLTRRTLFRTVPRNAPRLDCIPLVRWRRHFSYVDGTRSLQPRRLNRPHAPWHSSPTACLLCFSLLLEPEDDADAGLGTLRSQDLRTNASRRYRSSEDLVECGMLNPGQWF